MLLKYNGIIKPEDANPKTFKSKIRNLLKPPRKTVFLLLVVLVILFFQQKHAYKYPYIPRSNILKNLVEKVTSAIVKLDHKECRYEDIVEDNTVLSIPDSNTRIEFDDEKIASGEHIPNCKPKYSTAILVPYRNRKPQLDIFIPYMHSFLEKQNIHYRIFIIEQLGDGPWNKGKLFNAGAKVAIRLNYPCLILHDVDLLPLNPANLYACSSQPRHMSASIDKFRYNLPYDYLVGGVLAILKEQYITINGFSNNFENWGGEDDELANRIKTENLTIHRFSPDVSKYTMLKHNQEPKNEDRFRLIRENYGKHKTDGYTTLDYKRMTIINYNLYINISVEI